MITNHNECTFHILISLIGILLFAGSLNAQPGRERNQPPQLPDAPQIAKIVDELAVTIKLNKDQKSKISKIFTAHFAKMKKLMRKNDSDRKAMDSLKIKFEKDVKALLSSKQKKGFETFMAKHSPKPGQQRPGRK